MEAIYPDGRLEMLSCVNNYKFGWHIVYNYTDEAAAALPAGTMLHVISWHNNTAVEQLQSRSAELGRASASARSTTWLRVGQLRLARPTTTSRQQVADARGAQTRRNRPAHSSNRRRVGPMQAIV